MNTVTVKIDFLSDTVTRPSAAMRRAMFEAEVGDDVYGEDPSMARLESLSASQLGKPAACWLPSGTMANLSAVLAQCARAQELLLGDDCDLYHYEAGGPSVVGGVVLHPVPTNARGELALEQLRAALRDADDPQCAPAGLVAVETPHVRKGGIPLSLGYLAELRAFCDAHGLPLHIDGARLYNAAVALGRSVDDIARFGDTVQFCLSKSLGAPAGSIVAGDTATVARVRRWRKLLGGGMRQIGILAAAGTVALETMPQRLQQDHALARRLARGLSAVPGVTMAHETIHTNMVFFRIEHPAIDQGSVLQALAQRGIRMAELGHGNVRAVTHCHHTAEDIDTTVEAVRRILAAANQPERTHASSAA